MSWRSWAVVCAAFFTWGCSVVFDTSELLSGGPGGGGAGAAGGQGGAGAAGLGGAGAAGGQGGSGAAGGEGGNGAGSGGEGGIGPCGAGLTPCPMGCVNTLDDSEHCGACGHDCGGSGCLLGGCQAVELASFPAMHGLLLHNASDRVFFTTSNFGQHNNVVGAVSKQQGGDLEVFSVNEPASTYLALAGTSLYYTTWDQPSVRRVDLNQPGTGPNPVLSLPNPGFAIQVVGGEVVYGDYDVGLFSFEPVDVPIPSLRVAQSRIHHFLFDTENDSIVFTVAEPTSSVRRYFPNTMQLEELASADDAWDIVQDASYYYFSDQAEGTLRRIAKPASENGPTEPMADGLAGARGLALDDDYVYVVSGSVVTRVAKVPPFEYTFVATAATGNQIAVDEKFIYWTNISTGKLMKIAKPL